VKIRTATRDVEFLYLKTIDPNLEQWRVLAAEYVATLTASVDGGLNALKMFLVNYIHEQKLPTKPAEFLRADYEPPSFYELCLATRKSKSAVQSVHGSLSRFLDYVLNNYFSVEDDWGRRIVPPEFRNTLPPLPVGLAGHSDAPLESNKSVLPYRYVEELRKTLCPHDAKSFGDLTWAQTAGDSVKGGDWFIVSENAIDRDDPDCVWRLRATSKFEKYTGGVTESHIYEMWSPVRAIALYLKLELPLRTYQVRMLDSGEADTSRYSKGKWVKNDSTLAKGSDKAPCRRGVFRRMSDSLKQVDMTGLYINTNKTADRNKDEWSKGYELPWQHERVLYWLERLRNWQEKYNPISAPMPWTSLEPKHTGAMKAESQLKALGTTCFLFRDAAASGDDRFKPLAGTALIEALWYKLLAQLQQQCAERGERDLSGANLVFVKDHNRTTTLYPLHSLRVSLITAYALEGGVPMPILSKCIAGHARLVMTLYYTKGGITYVTEKMTEAETRLVANDQTNYARWLKDATYKDLESNGAYFNPEAIQAVLHAQSAGASMVKDDKGICPKGGFGCDTGGVFFNDDTSRVTYGEVPGYPERNCPRCRWFFTGPAFLGGLQNHWNFVSLQMTDTGERIVKLEAQIAGLEDEHFECESNDRPFAKQEALDALRRIWQTEMERNNKLGSDMNATLRLITRCRAIATEPGAVKGVKLIAAGTQSDVRLAIQECSKLEQVLTVIAGSTLYPENDIRKAALQAGRAYDLMLALNAKSPVFFRMTEDELVPVVQHMTLMLQAEAGSIKEAMPFVEGALALATYGLDTSVDEFVQRVGSDELPELLATPPEKRRLQPGNPRINFAPKSVKETAIGN
jgi:hypothetical protein